MPISIKKSISNLSIIIISSTLLPNIAFSTSTSLSANFSSNLKKVDSTEYYADSSFALSSSYNLSKIYSSSISLSIYKELTNERLSSLNDGSLSFKASINKNLYSLINLSSTKASVTVPISENSRKNTSLQTAISVSPTVIFDLSKTLVPKLSIIYIPTLKYSIHKYEVSAYGISNNKYALSNTLVFSYSYSDKISFAATNVYIRSYTYSGISQDSYYFDQSIGYKVNSQVGITVGHSIGGSALASNGTDQDIDFFDSNQSSVYSGFNYTF